MRFATGERRVSARDGRGERNAVVVLCARGQRYKFATDCKSSTQQYMYKDDIMHFFIALNKPLCVRGQRYKSAMIMLNMNVCISSLRCEQDVVCAWSEVQICDNQNSNMHFVLGLKRMLCVRDERCKSAMMKLNMYVCISLSR